MKKRKWIVLLIALFIAAMLLCSCGGSEPSADKEIVENTGGDEEKQEAANKETTIEETVLLEEKGIKITANGLEDGWLGTDLKLLIENTGDTNVTVQARNSSVNGFMVENLLSEDVAAGKKANASMTFSTTALKEANITTVAEMEFSFYIFETDSWDDYLTSDMITLKTSAADGYEQKVDDSGTVFYDAGDIRIIGKGLSADDSIFGPGLIVYIENNSKDDITVQVRDTSVNGFMVEPTMSQDLMSGKKAITAVTFFETDLEENGIEDITEIETSFHIFDMESWDDIAESEPITIPFE